MATIPLPALATRENQTDPIGEYGKLVALKGLMSNQAQQQQLQPLQLQEAQAQAQIAQKQASDMQSLAQLAPQHVVKDDQGNITGYDWNGLINDAAHKGVSVQTIQGLQKNNIENQTQLLNLTEKQRADKQAAIGDLYNHVEALRGVQDPEQRQQIYQSLLPTIGKTAQQLGIDPSQLPPQAPDDNRLNLFEAQLGMHQQQISDAGKQSEAAKNTAQAAEAQSKVPLNQIETQNKQQQQQAQQSWLQANPGKTVDDYAAMQAANKAGAEARARQPYEMALASFNKNAAKDNVLFEHGLNQVTDIFTNPQHGFTQTLSQAQATKDSIASSKDGSQLAASLAPLMTALGVTSFAGIHRINQTEVNSAGPQVGSVLRRINATLDKATQGKLQPDTAEEMTNLMDQLIKAKHDQSVNSAKMIATNAGIDPSKVMVMDQAGKPTLLSKAQGSAQTSPTPQTHVFDSAAWKAANPNGDIEAAKAAAQAQGYTVK